MKSGALTDQSRNFLAQDSTNAEEIVRRDLLMNVGLKIEALAINGDGNAPNPTGILQNSTIDTNSKVVASSSTLTLSSV